MQEARANGVGFITKDEAAKINAPTLIVWGKHDVLLPPTDAELLDRVIPNSKAVVLQKSGHIPQIEQPHEFNQSLHDFLSGRKVDAAESAQR
jgi:3-oxoadipate enol-lactonase